MHEWYRQYAQQMGMQNVRVLLPEQIDLHINTSIYDTIKNIIAEHITLTSRTVNENSKIGQINSLSTLYKETELEFVDPVTIDGAYPLNNAISLNSEDITANKALYICNIAVMHKYTKDGSTKLTAWVPVRLIDATLLANCLQDPALAPSINYPIAITNNNTNLLFYFGKNPGTGNDRLKRTSLSPYRAKIGYIGLPTKVDYNKNISCDLPDSLHIDILKHAVDLNTIAIQGSLFNSQKQQQRELQENASQARQQRGEDN